MDHEFVLHRAKRRHLERVYRLSKSPSNKDKFFRQRTHCNRLVKQKRCQYYKDAITSCNGDQKALFTFVKNLLDCDDTHGKYPILLDVNSNIKNDTDIATEFNSYFVKKIERIRSDINQSFDSYMPPVPTTTNTTQSSNHSKLTEFDPCTENEVKTLLASNCKTSICDILPTSMLSYCIDDITPFLTRLVNVSLLTGNIDNLKDAHVRPILKNTNADPDLYQSYRPISNLPFISKLIEKIVLSRLNIHMYHNNLLNHSQFGYKKQHSCEFLLLKLLNDLCVNIDNKNGAVVVMCDMSAAFDTVDHSILLNILSDHFAVSGIALRWFESFLTGRTQRVVVNESVSSSTNLSYGVPQGSVLGPVLFNIYTHSLSNVFSNFNYNSLSYADDTSGYFAFTVECQNEINSSINICMNSVKSWMNYHFLKLNEEKTQIITFGNKILHQQFVLDKISFICNNGVLSDLVLSEKVKYLGVILDKHLSLSAQINSVCSSCNYYMKKISSIRPFIGQSECESLVHGVITSRLDYCNALYFSLPQSLLSKLQRVQNTAARLVLQKRKRDSISLCLSQLHWLDVEKRIAFKVLTIMFKCANDSAPNLVTDLISPCTSFSRNSLYTFNILFNRSNYGRRAFSYYAPRLWNCLPITIRCASSIALFKSMLKTYLFSHYSELKQMYCRYAKIMS
jgi:hypothetical protein